MPLNKKSGSVDSVSVKMCYNVSIMIFYIVNMCLFQVNEELDILCAHLFHKS